VAAGKQSIASWQLLEPILRAQNPWWSDRELDVPAHRRRPFAGLASALKTGSLILVLRGPRQVGKTTTMLQIVQDLLRDGVPDTDVLFINFDEPLFQEPLALRTLLDGYETTIRRRSFAQGHWFAFFDEVHKIDNWATQVKALQERSDVRMMITGSSAVLVGRKARESLAGRTLTTEFPPFSFREVLETWEPHLVKGLPSPLDVHAIAEKGRAAFEHVRDATRPPTRRQALRQRLERYYTRGGYPRLHSGDVPDDRWADYVREAIFERVLGVDIPDLFPVDSPRALREVYLHVARQTGQQLSQLALAQKLNAAGIAVTQPTVGRYLHYLSDALLVREFRAYPSAHASAARKPVKVALTDLGVRNAIFRNAPSLFESPPEDVGPLVETLVQTVLWGTDLQVSFYRESVREQSRRVEREVDFIVEDDAGNALPIEVKFRAHIGPDDFAGLRALQARRHFDRAIMVTRDTWDERDEPPCLLVPLLDFLLAF
jgi:predicted AAA+ superfamily ATPase